MCYQPPGTDICITFKSSLMRGRFNRPAVKKKRRRGGPRDSTVVDDVFSLPDSLSNNLCLHMSLKKMVCEVGMGAKLSEECFNCHGFL